MKNIHILPTDKPSYLYKMSDGSLNISDLFEGGNSAWKNQNIYITSDEVKKNGEWVLSNLNEVVKFCSLYCQNYYKKIILTTDELYIHNDLIPKEYNTFPQYIQKIDDEFLEWFVNNPSCEEVEVLQYQDAYGKHINKYKIIIPKEEPKQLNSEDFGLPKFGTKEFNDLASQYFGGKPKQEETLEEVAEKEAEIRYPVLTHINPKDSPYVGSKKTFKHGVDFGVKWQQEQDKNKYSEEDLREAYLDGCKIQLTNIYHLEKWFNKFKKK